MLKHQHGGDIYSTTYKMDYSANINPLGTPDGVIKAAQKAVLNSAHYPDVECRKLRAALAEKEKVPAEMIICGNGAAELIFAVVQAVKPKKAVLITPGFAEYEQALLVNGCKIDYYQLSEENGFHYDERYLDYLTKETDMIFLCNPNNPTGIVMEKTWILQILKKCMENNIFAVMDSCFIDFLEDRQSADFVQEVLKNRNLFILKAFTKIYAMAGLRLGYGITSNESVRTGIKNVMQPWSVSIPAQEAGYAALFETEYVEKTRELIRCERVWLTEKMNELGLKTFDSGANYIFFTAPEDFGECLRQQGILIRDCGNYRGLTKGYYRIAVRTRRENQILIQAFSSILEK